MRLWETQDAPWKALGHLKPRVVANSGQTRIKRKVVVKDHPRARVAHEGEVKAIVSRKLHPGEALFKRRRQRSRTWAAIRGAEVERRPVPAGRECDDVIPLGV